MEKDISRIKHIFFHLGLVILASVLFALSFPNPIIKNGFPFSAWAALLPILIVIRKYGLLSCMAWGAVYGFCSYSLFNYWLANFHPLAGIIVNSIYLVYMVLVFALLKTAVIFFPKRGYLVQWVIWIAYEYLKTCGFLGYSYGVIGYSQWKMIPLIQIASVTGVWGVSALVTFPSFWLSEVTGNLNRKNAANKFPAIIWLVLFVAALVFGFVNLKDYSDSPKAQIALIQHNTDPWEASRAPNTSEMVRAYRKDLSALIRLSDKALESRPKPQIVVWPETAFVPRIHWHSTYRENRDLWPLVRDLLEYLAAQDVPFLIGNDDARMDPAKNPDPSERHRIDYNAALLFENGVNTALYRKLHLVPFTEYFPYKRQFPLVYEWLKNANTTFWEKGEDATVFLGPGFTFAAPICFEDTFGYLPRKFVRRDDGTRGADVLINMSNDAWSQSRSAQYQHLSMAVFRAVENRRSMARATTSGQTCAVDPNGRVIAEAPPFTETFLNAAVPLAGGYTVYTIFGDYFAVLFVILAAALLLFGAVRYIMGKRMRGAE